MKLFQSLLRRRISAGIAGFIGLAQAAAACTGIMMSGADGTNIRARTMEWGAFDLQSAVSSIPPGYEMSSIMDDGSAGATWTTQYGLGRRGATDGMNEAGLSGGLCYLPGFAEYPEYDPSHDGPSISPADFLTYALGNFATVAEVREAMEDIKIVSVFEESLGFAAPVHFFLADPTGARVVIEVVGQEMMLHDAPLGVITNSPAYDWHMTNLRNYLNLSATELPTQTVDGTDFAPIGSGTGMFGLPGDFTPPSRFVRAVAFSHSARPTEGVFDTVRESFRILDNFNVPAHGVTGGEEGDLVLSATQYTSVADMTNGRLYYHTQHNRRVRMIDLAEIDFAALGGEPITQPLDPVREEDIEAVTF